MHITYKSTPIHPNDYEAVRKELQTFLEACMNYVIKLPIDQSNAKTPWEGFWHSA